MMPLLCENIDVPKQNNLVYVIPSPDAITAIFFNVGGHFQQKVEYFLKHILLFISMNIL